MMRKISLILLCVFAITSLNAQKNTIEVKLGTDTVKHVLFAKYMLDKLYVIDTIFANDDKRFLIQGKDTLSEGIYALAISVGENNAILQFCLDNTVDQYSMYIEDITNPHSSLTVKGSKVTSALNEYMIYLKERSLEAAAIPEGPEKAEKMTALSKQVNAYQVKFVEDNAGSLPAAFVGASLPISIPDFEDITDEKERNLARWWYSKDHFFDYLDLKDERLLYTPFLFNKINEYVEKLTSPAPDSVSISLKRVLDSMNPESDMFRVYLSTFLTKYAGSKIVGYDAVYVFLAEEYYEKGFAYWTDPEQLAKIVDNAKKIKPTLMGKTAPDITLENKAGEKIRLHEFESEYTVMLFWAFDCGHCKKSMPEIIDFYNKFKDKGVEILGICTKFYNDKEKCWDFVEEKGIDIWTNTMDPYHQSKYKILYNIKSTPQIFILDKDKKILIKRIASEQLDEVMQNILDSNIQ